MPTPKGWSWKENPLSHMESYVVRVKEAAVSIQHWEADPWSCPLPLPRTSIQKQARQDKFLTAFLASLLL